MGFNSYLDSEILHRSEFHAELKEPLEIPLDAHFFIQKFLEKSGPDILFLNHSSEIPPKNQIHYSGLVSSFKLNDINNCNRFLIESNQSLSFGGLLVGSVETYANRKKRIKEKFPTVYGKVVYAWDSFIHRFLPKMPVTATIYDQLTGKGRLMSDVEALGRLYATGFELIEQQEIGGRMFFVAKKVGNPFKDANPTYWPIVKLRRIGKGGDEFTVFKLRTMYPYSEYLQDLVYQKNNLSEGGKFKDDFRISTMGKFLRKFWLDEIPMIWNLLRGEMKIVGVRPLSNQYFNLYNRELKERRIQFKPGLIPPYYADMPHTLEEIMSSEMRYLEAYSKSPFLTDFTYFFRIMKNIVFNGARSK
jgi:lipopolysaccharide/colanic/teichoic acid biosynthesis glycosyltransferase